MTTMQPLIYAQGDRIPGLTAKGHAARRTMMTEQDRQLYQLSAARFIPATHGGSIGLPARGSCYVASMGHSASPYFQHVYG